MRLFTSRTVGSSITLVTLVFCNLVSMIFRPNILNPTSTQDAAVAVQQLRAQIQQLERELYESKNKQVKEGKQRQHLESDQLPDQTILLSQHTFSVDHHLSEEQNKIFDALQSLPANEEDAIWDALHGREFQYRLTCPDDWEVTFQLLNQTNSSVIIGYHVGMIKNWRLIVRDQLHSLHSCGLGKLATRLFISYSNNVSLDEELTDLQSMLNRYSFGKKAELLYNGGQPVEGGAINAIHRESQRRYPNQAYPPVVNSSSHGDGDTAVFYFHTKGSSRYSPDWMDNMGTKFTYPTALYWRKYMEYFTTERPHVCIEKIVKQNKFGCGAYWLPQRKFYGGNFWVASARYLSTLEPLEIYDASEEDKRWNAEGWITGQLRDGGNFAIYAEKFVSPSDPPAGLYSYLIRPDVYSDYTKRWGF